MDDLRHRTPGRTVPFLCAPFLLFLLLPGYAPAQVVAAAPQAAPATAATANAADEDIEDEDRDVLPAPARRPGGR